MRKPRNKPFFCHDENLEFFTLRKTCNKFALFDSFVSLMKRQGTKDEQAITECNKSDKHIITHNTKDFRNPPNNIKIGVICIGLVDEEDWIPKFTKLLKYFPQHNDYYHKTILINNTILIKDRITGTTNLL